MDFSSLLVPVSDAAPCGTDLENNYDQRWTDLIALSTPEKKDDVLVPPRWPDVRDTALQIGRETRHLRLGVILSECALQLEGLPGLRDGLALIRAWCETFWDHVFPAGTLDDMRDFRPPVIEALNHPPFLVRVKAVPVSQSAGGRFSIAELETADTTDMSDPDAANQARLVQGGFGNTSKEILSTAREALLQSLDHARVIEEIFDEKFGNRYGVNLSNLRDTLFRMNTRLDPYLAGSSESAAADSGGTAESDGAGGGGLTSGGNAIASREAAIRQLDKVIGWFETNEPSSPIPFLLRRAQRCVGMSFFQIIEELAIDRAQAELILKPQLASGES